MIVSAVFADVREVEMLIPFSRGDAVSAIMAKSKPILTEYRPEGTYLKVELNAEDRGRWQSFILQ